MGISSYPLFSVLGIEIEYMLVDKTTLNVQPKSDIILKSLAGKVVNEVVLGEIAASNELVMHVLELKNNGPKPLQYPTADAFQNAIIQLQPLLDAHHLQLLPTGAHPWMNPFLETARWPHDNEALYRQYDSIFNCQGHGWANLQSMHINLPFENDHDFCQLHNAIRLLLPLLPALAASTPFLEGKKTGLLDSRLHFYNSNQQRIPSISGEIIPEFIVSQAQYKEKILEPMYQAIRPFDPAGLLQHEWLNSRAAIAKFKSNAIEIRIVDTQECVNADVAIAHLIHTLLKQWVDSGHMDALQTPYPTTALKGIYEATLKEGMDVFISDKALLTQWQLPPKPMKIRDIFSYFIENISPSLGQTSQCALEHILVHGNLSERLLKAAYNNKNRSSLYAIYRTLGECLLTNQQYMP